MAGAGHELHMERGYWAYRRFVAAVWSPVKPGRSRGEFVLVTPVLNGTRRLEWIVVYTDPEGFAQQQVVQGEPVLSATMDADTRSSAH